jgi:hypothetical protein
MLDIKANDVRLKKASARVAINNDRGNITYVAIDAKICWQSTWVSWGKSADQPTIQIGDDVYLIKIEKVQS